MILMIPECKLTVKIGYLLIYPKRVDVGFAENSNEKLQSYYFGNKKKGHCFCPQCGSSVLIDFKDSDNLAQRPHLGLNVSLPPLAQSFATDSF